MFATTLTSARHSKLHKPSADPGQPSKQTSPKNTDKPDGVHIGEISPILDLPPLHLPDVGWQKRGKIVEVFQGSGLTFQTAA